MILKTLPVGIGCNNQIRIRLIRQILLESGTDRDQTMQLMLQQVANQLIVFRNSTPRQIREYSSTWQITRLLTKMCQGNVKRIQIHAVCIIQKQALVYTTLDLEPHLYRL